jgi:two-component system response regulator PilR (NtrC family)
MLEAMERSGGVQTRAAELLGMTFRSFRYFAKKYELSRESEASGEAARTDANALEVT